VDIESDSNKEEEIKKEHLGKYISQILAENLQNPNSSDSLLAKIGEELIVYLGYGTLRIVDTKSNQSFEILSKDSFVSMNSAQSMRGLGMKLETYLQDSAFRQSNIERHLEVYQREIDYSQNFIETFQIDDKYEQMNQLEAELRELKSEMLASNQEKDLEKEDDSMEV
jgi:hypothetical protein